MQFTKTIIKWYRYLYGLSLRLRLSLLMLSVLLTLLMAGCSQLPSFLTGGGPNVAANTQIGKTNSQTLGVTNHVAPTTTVRPNSRVETIDQSTNNTTNQQVPTWVWVIGILLFIVGWVTDTPSTIIRNLWRKKDA